MAQKVIYLLKEETFKQSGPKRVGQGMQGKNGGCDGGKNGEPEKGKSWFDAKREKELKRGNGVAERRFVKSTRKEGKALGVKQGKCT